MNKISKKIVALVTMAAFVLTLVPAAAFAGTANDVTIEQRAVDSVNVAFSAEKSDVTIAVTDAEDNPVNVTMKNNDGSSDTSDQTNKEIATVGNGYDYRIPLSAGTYTISVVADDQTLTTEKVYVYGAAKSEQSKYGVIENDAVQAEATVEVNTDLETTFYVNDSNGAASGDKLATVYVWAENEKGEVTGLSKAEKDKDANFTIAATEKVDDTDRYVYKLTNVANGDKLNVQFDAAGEYTLYAGVGSSLANAQKATLDKNGTKTIVTVTDDSEITALDLTAEVNGVDEDLDFNKDTKTYTLDLTDNDFDYDGNDKIIINGTAYVGSKLATGKTINFETTAPKSVVELWNTDNNTGNDGVFGTTITMQDKQNALISITDSEGNVEYTLRIVAQKTTATNIDRTKTGGYVLAGTDKDYASAVYNTNNAVKFDNAVEFEITDQKGNLVTDDAAAASATIDIKGKPTKSTLDNDDLSLVSLGNGKYTLAYANKNDQDGYAKDLLEGEYTVRVSLPSEDNATVTFNAAEFGKIKNVEIELNTLDGSNTPVYKLDNEVQLGDKVGVGLVYVDGNGIKVPCTKTFDWSVKSPAHAVVDTNADYTNGTFTLKADTIEHQGVIGSEVTVQAAVPGYGLVEKTLTIVDSYNEYSLEFDPTEGPVNEYNKVDVTVLEDDGDEARVSGTVKAVLVDSSNEDAKVSVEVNKNNQLVIYSDQETELDIAVTVNSGNQIIAAGTLNYTVGAADPLAGRSVVMTIGSSEYVVNNQIITGDAAPFIDSNWRTMVPIRALAEAFDAEVNWDNDARTVTINYDADTQIVMTIGEDTYTVNGAEQTMDTEPVIQGERTYVPIRFAAEALGFTVTPLYTAEGTTGSVVFQR